MYTEEKARELLVEAGLRLVESGLIARTWGNISAKISEDEFIITPSGIPYERLTPEMMVKVKISDLSYAGDIKPSSEKGIHAKAYLHREDVNFIIHTHQTYATALSVTYMDMDIEDSEKAAILGDKLVTARYGMPSTKKLMHNVEAAIVRNPKANSILLMNHGTLCMGRDYEDAFLIANTLEELAEKMVNRKIKIDNNEEREGEEFIAIAREYVKDRVITFDGSPITRKMSSLIDNNMHLLDDYVQIAGKRIATVNAEKSKLKEKADREAAGKEIRRALNKSTVVFIKDEGAIIGAPSEDEGKAIKSILNKYGIARLYAAGNEAVHKIKPLDAVIQRFVYVKKYSKKAKEQ